MADRGIVYRRLPTPRAPAGPTGTAVLRSLIDVLDRVAAGDAWVVLVGEPGAGRRAAAHRLHHRSVRAAGPLVELDGDALVASRKPPAVARAAADAAAGGTLIVRDAARLNAACIEALRTSDVRALLLLGPDDDRWSACPDGVVTVRIPPLRERRADLPALVAALLADRGPDAPRLDDDALARFTDHDWAGNVAELTAVLALLALRRPRGVVRAADLDQPLLSPALSTSLGELERRHILAVLDACGGNRSVAARTLGISPRTLYNRMRRYHGEPAPEPTGGR